MGTWVMLDKFKFYQKNLEFTMPRTARDQSATGIYHVMIRDAVIKGCGLRGISLSSLLSSRACNASSLNISDI